MAFNLRGFVEGHKVLVGVALLIALLTGWWKYEFPSGTWRYKMTVTVETPEGLKTGYAVREVFYTDGPKLLPDVAGSQWGVKGEAVVVDMGHGAYLFALVDDDGSAWIRDDIFPDSPRHPDQNVVRHYAKMEGKKTTLDKKLYPRFVTFTDIKDPKSVVAVARDNLAGPFGAGVTLKDITIEMTEEDVTWGIEQYLGWLPTVKKGSLDGSDVTTGSSYANTLHIGYFTRGEQQ
jgi:hypothetical protein